MACLRNILLLLLSAVALNAEDHWAYLPPKDTPPPTDGTHSIDAFLRQAHQDARLKSSSPADPTTWLKRAAYTLTGLPPSETQLRRIAENPNESNWEALIDELLASPSYGERWARHWMDVARYADTQGYNFGRDNRFPFAYTYRDWLIRSFNDDLPYPEFVKLQIAADHLTDRPDHPDLAALGFLTVGPRSGRVETIDDRVDVVTRGFLSSTVSCARCHDHKTDPISIEDYYSLFSIFENTVEPEEKPTIGTPSDEAAHQEYLAEASKLEAADLAARQEITDHLRTPETSAVYLELAWLSAHKDWDTGKTSGEAFNRGRFRLGAVERWKTFFEKHRDVARIAAWREAMSSADDEQRKALCLDLATEWSQAAPEGDLANLASQPDCPLALGPDRVREIMDQKDGDDSRERAAQLSKLQADHPGSTPRAMSLGDRKDFLNAQVYLRGNPDSRGEPFDRHWLSFLGGETFPDDQSPRLSLAEKIADPTNPLTSRVLVNRVWAWHFGAPLADPGDFGPQQPAPPLLPLLDWLALRFDESGGSLKQLHRIILTSAAFRLSSHGPTENDAIDEANTLFWKWNLRRSDFESMRDRLLASSGSLDTATLGGRSFSLKDDASDSRRSVYAFIDRYAVPSTFVSFDLPHPDHHAPARAETTVPQQALYFLNSPLVLRQAEKLAAHPELLTLPDHPAKIRWLYQRIFQRPPTGDEIETISAWIDAADPSNPYADLIQMLWSSNEFHHVD